MSSSYKFKNEKGQYYTQRLFYEMAYHINDQSTIIYTLKDYDNNGYLSLKKLYLEESDITEYRFASKYFDSWYHWTLVANATWFKPYIEEWRKELKLKLKRGMVDGLEEMARNPDSKNRMEAIKILLGMVAPKEGKGRGRPSKEEEKAIRNSIADEEKTLQEEYRRVVGNEA